MIASKILQSSHRRVVVTGIGAITPLGNTIDSTWKTLINNHDDNDDTVGITTLEQAMQIQQLPDPIFNYEIELARKLPSQVAAPVRGVEYCPRTNRFVQLALLAADDAMKNSDLYSWLGIQETNADQESPIDAIEQQTRFEKIGVCMASGMSSVREITASNQTVDQNKSLRRLSPHFVPKVLCNSASSRISLKYKLQGPNLAPSTACAAGAHAIGEAMRCIQYSDADIMIAGGSEACIDPISMGGFARLKALSTSFNDDPKLSSRPFSGDRDGFVMGEGAAVLVLEELEHAKQRNAPILCELKGYGLSGDGYHVTSPDPNGRGAERAMKMAMDRAGIEACDVDYVNAHATSTPMGDEIEERTIARVLNGDGSSDQREKNVYVSSTKGATGHLLGAAGAIEGAFAVMAIQNGIVPITRNLSKSDFEGFHHVVESPISENIDVAISNSFGFGGTNASLVFAALKL